MNKTEEGEWLAEVLNKITSVIVLPKLNIKLSLSDIYFKIDLL